MSLIDADKPRKALLQVITDEKRKGHATEDLEQVVYFLDACPTVDAVPVVHGRWIEKPNPWGQDGSHSYDCSICGERTCVLGHKLRYCPHCGAKMDEGVQGNV